MQVRTNPQKWSRNSAAAAGDYALGVQSPRRPWAASTVAAEDNFASGVNEAIAQNRFSKGVNKAGDGAWQKGVSEKGRQRYGQGVAVAESKYSQKFAPFAAALGSLTLPPKGPKGTNYGNTQLVGEALRTAKNNA